MSDDVIISNLVLDLGPDAAFSAHRTAPYRVWDDDAEPTPSRYVIQMGAARLLMADETVVARLQDALSALLEMPVPPEAKSVLGRST